MSGDVQARRGGPGGGKLKNRNKKRAMMQELEKQEYHQEKLDHPIIDNAQNVLLNISALSLSDVMRYLL